MAYIGPLPAETFTSFATQEFTTSATTSYTLNHPVTNENELALFINNVRQQPGSGKAYTATGTALTLSEATASTDTMYAVFLGRALQTVNPADASVGSSQIAAEMITGQTALASEPADTDEFLISDAGTLKRIDYSLIKGGGGLVHIKTQTISSSVTSVQFIHGTSDVVFDGTYKAYKLIITGGTVVNDTQKPHIRFTQGSGFITSGYSFSGLTRSAANSDLSFHSNSDSDIRMINDGIGNASDETFSIEVNFNNPATTDVHKLIHGTVTGIRADGNTISGFFGGGYLGNTSAITGFEIGVGSGNIDGGTFSLFGVVNS